MVAVISTKHQEAVLFQEKAQKAADDMERDAAENSRLQVAYNNLVHDYNQIEMQLNSVKKEASRVKESLNHLEVSSIEVLKSCLPNIYCGSLVYIGRNTRPKLNFESPARPEIQPMGQLKHS